MGGTIPPCPTGNSGVLSGYLTALLWILNFQSAGGFWKTAVYGA
nr:MAG TPA: hypothetical protein [Caudoviricetes sp.]